MVLPYVCVYIDHIAVCMRVNMFLPGLVLRTSGTNNVVTIMVVKMTELIITGIIISVHRTPVFFFF